MAAAFANIFKGEIEKKTLNKSAHKPLAWKRYVDDIISLWLTSRNVVEKFIEQANKHHPSIYRWDIMYGCDFLRHHDVQGPKIQQRVRSRYDDALQTNGGIPVHVLCNMSPTGSKQRVGKGEALRLLEQTLQTKRLKRTLSHLKNTLWRPQNFINNTLSEVKFQGWTQALLQRNKTKKRILPFVIKPQSLLSKGSQRISSV